MKTTTLKKKYPEIWDEVYNNVTCDLLSCMPGCDIELHKSGHKANRIDRIAYNAAFFACNAVHHEIRRGHLKLIK